MPTDTWGDIELRLVRGCSAFLEIQHVLVSYHVQDNVRYDTSDLCEGFTLCVSPPISIPLGESLVW